ncbi:hypothetical protein [Paraglaciecola sp.]|uniref:hypothetical protein n=1 Tax=Paraglaciecola sp. TaxID=1920173 RepID=UPI003EF75F4C
MYDFLYLISEYLLLLNVAALFAIYLMAKQRTSIGITLLFAVVLQIFHVWYEVFLLETLSESLSKNAIRTLWYMGFGLTDFLFIIITIFCCLKMNLPRDKASSFILISYGLLGATQMIRYADRVLLQSDLFGFIYKHLIPTFNLGITITVIIFVFTTMFGKLNNQNGEL